MSLQSLLRGHAWSIGLFALLVLLLGLTKIIQPSFGYSGLESLSRAALPFAFATAAMAIVVIVGGIDLSVASIMAACSVTMAVLTPTLGGGAAVLIALGAGMAMGAINGALIVLTRVPDIVVTLAMLFVWEGTALMILSSPGGQVPAWLQGSINGYFLVEGLPRALVLMGVLIAIVWLPVRRSNLGLSIYATGSFERAAFRSGVNTGRTKVIAYALCGLFAGMGGISLGMLTGIGEPVPGPYLLASVAAVVLGGVALGGGKGGLLGPIIAVFILRIIRTILTLAAVDPNVTTIVEGIIMVAVVMLGALFLTKERRVA